MNPDRVFQAMRVGTRVEVAMQATPSIGKPGWYMRAYDDPDQAVADATDFLMAAVLARRERDTS